MDYIIKNVTVPQLPTMISIPTMPKAFVIAYTKTVLDINGVEVTIPDHEERITVEQLTSQKAALQAQMDELDKKLAAIEEASTVSEAKLEAAKAVEP